MATQFLVKSVSLVAGLSGMEKDVYDFLIVEQNAAKRLCKLTHWSQYKIATNFLMTFSNAFSWMKIYEFRLRFHWRLFPRSNKQYSSIGSDFGLSPARQQAIIWTNDGQFTDTYVHHSSLNELIIQASISMLVMLLNVEPGCLFNV